MKLPKSLCDKILKRDDADIKSMIREMNEKWIIYSGAKRSIRVVRRPALIDKKDFLWHFIVLTNPRSIHGRIKVLPFATEPVDENLNPNRDLLVIEITYNILDDYRYGLVSVLRHLYPDYDIVLFFKGSLLHKWRELKTMRKFDKYVKKYSDLCENTKQKKD